MVQKQSECSGVLCRLLTILGGCFIQKAVNGFHKDKDLPCDIALYFTVCASWILFFFSCIIQDFFSLIIYQALIKPPCASILKMANGTMVLSSLNSLKWGGLPALCAECRWTKLAQCHQLWSKGCPTSAADSKTKVPLACYGDSDWAVYCIPNWQ